MRQSRPLLPIRPLELPARLGRRQRLQRRPGSCLAEVRTRFEQSNLAAARAAGSVWLRGPLFQSASSHSSLDVERHAA
jgi:hypothetical protein